MNRNRKPQQWLKSATLGLALGGLAISGLAQTTDWMQTFDATGTTGPWVTWWGSAAITWDGTQDSTTNVPGSGAMKYVSSFTGAGGEQFMTFAGFHYGWQWDGSTVMDGTKLTNLIFDIKIDPSTAPAVNGTDCGQLQLGFTAPGWPASGVPTVGYYTIPLTATNWTHVVLPIDPTATGMGSINGIYIKMWSNGHLTNTWTAYFDNLEVQTIPTNAAPPAAPIMSLENTTPGLQLISTTKGGANARYSIHTLSPTASWINSPTSTTYSVTIKDYPRPFSSYAGFQTHMFLIPSGSLPYGPNDNSGDWNSTNLVFVQIADNGNGSAYARFMWKQDIAGGGWGGQIFGSNVFLFGSSSILGTWSVTFNNNTNVTCTGSDGSSTNFNLPPSVVAAFTDTAGIYAYFGMQPNGAGNVGQDSVMASVSITGAVDGTGGTVSDIQDNFAAPPLDTSIWGLAASDNNGVQVVGADTPFWLQWTLPASDYVLGWSPDYPPSSGWNDPGLTPIQLGPVMRALVPNWLSSTNTAFFNMTNAVLGSNSQNTVAYERFDLAQGTNHITMPILKSPSYAIGDEIHFAPTNAFVVGPEGQNLFVPPLGWQHPTRILGPGAGYDFYNPDPATWSVTFVGDVVGGAPVVLYPPQGNTLGIGDGTTLSVYAGGDPTLAYQWKHAGTNLSSATGTSLSLANLQTSQAGSYTVVVTNSLGSATSAAAVLNVVTAAATLGSTSMVTNGTYFQFTVNGLPNRIYVVQSSPNVNVGPWTPVYTNTGNVPFTLSQPANAPRYYRAVYSHQIINP